MASTRPSSPVDTASPLAASPQLSPRSKIKAMLAAVDDAETSDEDASAPIDAKKLFASIDKTKAAAVTANTQDPEDHDNEEEDEDEDEDEDEPLRPRGRMAARMLAEFKRPTEALASPLVTPGISSPSTESASIDDEGEDDDGPVVIRRKLTRPTQRSKTPEPQPTADRHSSPEALFVSPASQKSAGSDHHVNSESDEEEMPSDLSKSARFQALVEKKRKERLEKEAEEERRREARARAQQMPADSDSDDVSDISDDDAGRKLTQDVSRPTRKASKRALEEMNRETQRLSRSLQLAHEVKTKKKITKASLFERFNFRSGMSAAVPPAQSTSSSRPTTPGSTRHTDAEVADAATPPSSPPSISKKRAEQPVEDTATKKPGTDTRTLVEDVSGDLPDIDDIFAQLKQHNKGKGTANAPVAVDSIPESEGSKKPRRQVRVKLPSVQANMVTNDSDDELEITEAKKGRLDAVFARVPENKSQASTGMQILRNLAYVSSPTKEPARGRNTKPSMTTVELHMSLQQRAKAQAKLARERRLDALRAKGVVVQTAEERDREREQVEDIVNRARQEVEEIMQREREDAKKARKEKRQNGEADPLAWDDSDDESFQGSEGEGEADVEISGSEDEESAEEAEADDGEVEALNSNVLIDEADEVRSEENEPIGDASSHGEDEETTILERSSILISRRPKKRVQIVSDDEEEDDNEDAAIKATPRPKSILFKSPSAPGSGSPKAPTSVLRSATKTFIPGFPIAAAAPAGLGLTQIFAGTMDDSQAASGNGSAAEFIPSFDVFPDSQFSATAGESQNVQLVSDSQATRKMDSQTGESQTQGLQLHYSQSQAHGFDSLVDPIASQMSEVLEPTQDAGFQEYTPLRQRFVDPPQSTVDTLPYNGTPDGDSVQVSPLVRRKGKLIRRTDRAVSISTLPATEIPESSEAGPESTVQGTIDEQATTSDAFKKMQKAAKRVKRLKKKFDKKKSEATEMIEEQAEESEDEYAGLGGADGEDSSDEDEEFAKEMIDDTGKYDGDESKIAGLYADRARAEDAAQVDKLFRDITTGMLRKRRRGGGGEGHDFDLSDSDDGGEARRRMKRRQFAKMQKALFADERIGKIAENPRNAAFLKSIEDRNEDEWDFGDNFAAADAASASGDDSQSQPAVKESQGADESEQTAIPDSQPQAQPPAAAMGRKRSRMDDHGSRPEPHGKVRRIQAGAARPSSIADVRRSLSSLLEEPNGSIGSVIIPGTYDEEDEDGEGDDASTVQSSNKENRDRAGGDGRSRNTAAVVDRIVLKRGSSSMTGSATGKLAFAAPSSSASGSGFKVPVLLRKATTNSLMSNSSSGSTASGQGQTATSTTTGGVGSGGKSAGATLNKAAAFGDEGKVKKNAGKRSGINYFAHENERRAKVADAEKRREARKWKGAEGRGKVVGGLFGGGHFE